ncbi:Potassium channel toxin alpha-KTx 10.1 [Frankliniella fusca]|uniref:Potassium channel toxin alpha-KTx 10.1 n=1 Tax=Frankliniella fusca TaxID=407009 RepID=A0AAE1L8R7_9NEOP|nr:Potassium channel toxin alpha-KTx 10.1 [Frankliniella fusca]
MAVKVIALVLVFGAVVALSEQRVLIVEVPSSEYSVDSPGPGPGLGPGAAPAAAAPPPPHDPEIVEAGEAGAAATAQLTVPRSDVEALTRFLRFHYRKYLLRLFPLQHEEGKNNNETYADGDNQCDPDECYSHCYLQGFRSGRCKENKCFCTQSPASTTTTPRPV